MNRNKIKIIACLSMLLDHIGYFLFPSVLWLRWAGRLAFPLFAFFIGEGARHTRSRKKYLVQLLVLGIGCQSVYIAEEIITNGMPSVSSGCWFFNIILTFAVAAAGCFLLLDAKKDKSRRHITYFILYIIIAFGGGAALWLLRRKTSSAFYFDYGLCGLLLPLSVVLSDDKKKKLLFFASATVIYCVTFTSQMNYVWFSLAAVALLIVYNGEGGSRKLKYFFYVFYPAHLGILYLVGEMLR